MKVPKIAEKVKPKVNTESIKGIRGYKDLTFILTVGVIVCLLLLIPTNKEGGYVGTVQTAQSESTDTVKVLLQHTGEVVSAKVNKEANHSIGEEVIVIKENHLGYIIYRIE